MSAIAGVFWAAGLIMEVQPVPVKFASRPQEDQEACKVGVWSIFRPTRYYYHRKALTENMDLTPSGRTLQFSWQEDAETCVFVST
jgi:hypothetical protein